MPRRQRAIWVTVSVFIAIGAVFLILAVKTNSVLANVTKTIVPLLAFYVSTATLVGATLQYSESSRRQAILLTIDGYSRWSDSTWEARHHLARVLGEEILSDKVARAFADGTKWPKEEVPIASEEERDVIFREMISILNGLERISIAVQRGAYDLDTLHALAGTLIVRQWERYEPYVKARRDARPSLRRQTRTFTNLEALATRLKSRKLKDDKKNVDREYLDRLSTTD